MSREYEKVRGDHGLFSKYVQSSLYFRSDGDLGILLHLRDPSDPSKAGDTIGSAKLSDTEAIRSMIRGVECGMIAMLRWEVKEKE